MRAITSTFVSLTLIVVASGCSSSSGTDTPNTDAGTDTATVSDTKASDTATVGDTIPSSDSKTDSKPATETGSDTATGDCDPVAQTGCSGASSKCTAIDDGAGDNGVVAGCVTPGGTVAVDAVCTRASEDSAGIGNDTCAPGAYCSGIGSLTTPPSRHCRKFCAKDTDCGSAQKCSTLIADAGGGIDGICVPTCTLFGTDCASGQNCSVLIADMDGTSLYGTCRAAGTGVADSACPKGTECGPDLACADPTSSGTATCIPLCDTAHACPTGKTCKTSGGLASGGGLCE